MKEALVLFSGGKDSLLSTVKYLDRGYKVYLVTFDNSCGLGIKNVKSTINRLIKRYGNEKIEFIGIKDISAIFRNFINPFYNYKLDYILKEFGNINISEFNCLACRVSMYIASIIICKQKCIDVVVDGARTCQLFAIEQEKLLNKFIKLFEKYNIKIDYPVKDIDSDWYLKNALLLRGIIPKTIEPQCLLGCPIINKEIDKDLLNSISSVYDKYMLERIIKLIDDYSNINICEDFI